MSDVQADPQEAASEVAAPVAEQPAAVPSRESLIARMRARFDALEAKIKTGAVVYAHEVDDLFEHVKAAL